MLSTGLVFISAKSEDYPYAREIFNFLTERGVRAFFSPSSLSRMGDADYRRAIDNALEEAEHLIVVCSSRANVASSWVEAEWGAFINERRSQRKSGNLITVLAGDMSVANLPISLRQFEVIEFSAENFPRLLPYVGYAEEPPPDPPMPVEVVHQEARAVITAPVVPAQPVYAQVDEVVQPQPGVLAPDNIPYLVLLQSLYIDGEYLFHNLAVSTDNRFVAASSKGKIVIWNTHSWQHEKTLEFETDRIPLMVFAPGRDLLVVYADYASIEFWDTITWEMRNSAPVCQSDDDCFEMNSLSVDPMGHYLVGGGYAGQDGATRTWRLNDGAQIATSPAQSGDILSAACAGNGSVLVDGGYGKRLRLMDARTLMVKQEAELNSKVNSLAFSSDGRLIAAGLDDKSVTCWQADGLSPVASLAEHSGAVYDVGFSPDGRLLASAGEDGRIGVWQVQPLTNLIFIDAGVQYTTNVQFSPNGKWLLSALLDGSVSVWGLPE